jgi:hypothetical protein
LLDKTRGTLITNWYCREDDFIGATLQVHELGHVWHTLKIVALHQTNLETPFPWPPGQEPQDDTRVEAIAQAAHELVEKRDNWLNPPGASEEELKKRTLTNLYNSARPGWTWPTKARHAVFDAWLAPQFEHEVLLGCWSELGAGRGC